MRALATDGMGRSVVMPFVLLLVAATASPAVAAPAQEATLARRLDAAIGAFPGTAGVAMVDARTGFRYGWGADRVMPAASLYKLGVMVEAYRRAAEGSLSLDDTAVTISDDDLTEDGYYTDASSVLTAGDAIERMITLSDNSPARALTRQLDAHRINATLTALGLTDTRINTALPDDEQTADYNTTSARDMATLLLGLARGEIVGPAASRQMLDVLGRQQINDRLPAGLPAGTKIAHKTGDLPGVAHDVGVIDAPMGPRIVVVLTTDAPSHDAVVTLAEQLASIAYITPLDAFAARFDRIAAPRVSRSGDLVRWEIGVRNASTFTWDPGTTYVVERIRSSVGATRELGRITLPPLAPGASLPLVVNVVAPAEPGTFVVELEVVDLALGTSGNSAPLILVVRP